MSFLPAAEAESEKTVFTGRAVVGTGFGTYFGCYTACPVFHEAGYETISLYAWRVSGLDGLPFTFETRGGVGEVALAEVCFYGPRGPIDCQPAWWDGIETGVVPAGTTRIEVGACIGADVSFVLTIG